MIRPFGESALLVEVESPDQARALAWTIEVQPPRGVVAAVPGRRSVLVELVGEAPRAPVISTLERLVRAPPSHAPAGRWRRIPVVYGGEHGPDLVLAAEQCGLTPAQLVERHAAAELTVLFCGFAPGFAYLGDLPPDIRVPRLDTPRMRTPAGSVAVAGPMSGIYPTDLPGGWRVIGRTPLVLFDPRRTPPAYLAPGDRVRFEPMRAQDWRSVSPVAEDW